MEKIKNKGVGTLPVIQFEVVYSDDEEEGGHLSRPYMPLGICFGEALQRMADADEKVIKTDLIRILYEYPFDNTGPTELERKLGGWIFEVKAPTKHLTRADLVTAIANRYQNIYAEDGRTATDPGEYTSVPSKGKYGIWGYRLDDLILHSVTYNAYHDIYRLKIGS